ncbi:MAG: MerR family transcriptional regulator [Actinomycetes bacterium]
MSDPGMDKRGSMTIGAVCELLAREFPDLSISKIRYLEDRGLLSPRRTAGGYRVYGKAEVDRLRTILRLQRDEFMPLNVIRRELAGGRSQADVPAPGNAAAPKRSAVTVNRSGTWTPLDEVIDETGVEPQLIAELEDYGVIKGEHRDGVAGYDDTEVEIIRAVGELARYGVAGRNLRVLRSSADREAALLQQILAPALRSRNPKRREEAVEALENLASVTSYLGHLLLVRDLRRMAAGR